MKKETKSLILFSTIAFAIGSLFTFIVFQHCTYAYTLPGDKDWKGDAINRERDAAPMVTTFLTQQRPAHQGYFFSRNVFDNIFKNKLNRGVVVYIGMNLPNDYRVLIEGANSDSVNIKTTLTAEDCYMSDTYCPVICGNLKGYLPD